MKLLPLNSLLSLCFLNSVLFTAGSPECCSEKTVDGDKYSMTVDWVVSDNSSCFEKKSIGDSPAADKVKQKSCDSQEPHGEYVAIAWEFGFFTMSDPYLEITVKPKNPGAHIILTPHNHYNKKQQDIYEIVIGGSTNSESLIRKGYGGKTLANHKEKGLVSSTEYRTFWIWANNIGNKLYIAVGKKGQKEFMMGQETNPSEINYYGLGSEGRETTYYKLLRPAVYFGGSRNLKTPKYFDWNMDKVSFKVRSPYNVVVSLSPTANANVNFGNYEIIFAWNKPNHKNNHAIWINRSRRKEINIATGKIEGLVTQYEYRGFWISTKYTGGHLTIEMGREGEEKPFVSGTDTSPIADCTKFISFSNWAADRFTNGVKSWGFFKHVIGTNDNGESKRIF